MPKLNVLGLRRPPRRVETRTFTDPAQPGKELTLTLGAQDVVVGGRASDLTQDLIEKYVHPPDETEPNAFPMEGDEPIFLSEILCQQVGVIAESQLGPEAERYTPEEIIAVAVAMPDAWTQILAWVGGMSRREKDRSKESPTATTEP